MQLNQQVFERLKEIRWFTNCQRPEQELSSVGLDVVWVADWASAIESLSSIEWENTNLQARNALTTYLTKKHPSAYSEWNKLTREARPKVEEIVAHVAQEFAVRHELGQRFVDLVKWDALASVMEATYKPLRPPLFYEKLLVVYEYGRVPCGWKGEWPNGQLMVI